MYRVSSRPLSVARAASERQVGVCRHFTLLRIAMLRTQGIDRHALAAASEPITKTGKYLDHWATEYWNEAGKCWVLFDSQLDQPAARFFGIAL